MMLQISAPRVCATFQKVIDNFWRGQCQGMEDLPICTCGQKIAAVGQFLENEPLILIIEIIPTRRRSVCLPVPRSFEIGSSVYEVCCVAYQDNEHLTGDVYFKSNAAVMAGGGGSEIRSMIASPRLLFCRLLDSSQISFVDFPHQPLFACVRPSVRPTVKRQQKSQCAGQGIQPVQDEKDEGVKLARK